MPEKPPSLETRDDLYRKLEIAGEWFTECRLLAERSGGMSAEANQRRDRAISGCDILLDRLIIINFIDENGVEGGSA